MGSKMSNTEWGLYLGTLAAIDLIQFILDMFVLGIVANRFIDIFVGMADLLYLKIRGVNLDSKKLGGMVGTLLLEEIPGVDALPLWCLDGFMNFMLDRADKRKALSNN